LRGWTSASFDVRVHADVYEAFFNSPRGLRGQYATNESTGWKANRKLLDALEPALLEYAKPRTSVVLGLVRASLRGVDAKIWIATTKETDDQLSDPHPSIDYEPWERNEPNGEGLRAPVGTMLVVKGAWLDTVGNEVRDELKTGRDTYIYEKGRPN
jgi:hypothetical protein